MLTAHVPVSITRGTQCLSSVSEGMPFIGIFIYWSKKYLRFGENGCLAWRLVLSVLKCSTNPWVCRRMILWRQATLGRACLVVTENLKHERNKTSSKNTQCFTLELQLWRACISGLGSWKVHIYRTKAYHYGCNLELRKLAANPAHRRHV